MSPYRLIHGTVSIPIIKLALISRNKYAKGCTYHLINIPTPVDNALRVLCYASVDIEMPVHVLLLLLPPSIVVRKPSCALPTLVWLRSV